MGVKVTEPRNLRTEVKTGRFNQAFGCRCSLTLTDQMRVNQRLVECHTSQGNSDDEQNPKGPGEFQSHPVYDPPPRRLKSRQVRSHFTVS